MMAAWGEVIAAAIAGSVATGMVMATWLKSRIAIAINKGPESLSDALMAYVGSDDGKEFFLGDGAIQWLQTELDGALGNGKIHLHPTGRQIESLDQAELVPRLSNLIVDWALSKELEARVVMWCQGLHRNQASTTLAEILPSPIVNALDKGTVWLSKVPQRNSRWITLFIDNLRTQEKKIGEFISERTLDEIMDTFETRMRFIANNTDILDHPVLLDSFLPWWAEYSKEKISFWESAGVGLFNTFKLGLPVNPADGRAVLKWWSNPENQTKTKQTLQQKINDLLASDSRLLLRAKIQSQRERRVCDFIAEIPDPVFDSFATTLMTEAASPEWEHWIYGASQKILHFGLNRKVAAYLDDLNGWRPEATMSVEDAMSENAGRFFNWCRSEQMEPEIKRWLSNFFQDWLSEIRFESGMTRPILEKSLRKTQKGLEKELGDNGRLRQTIKTSLMTTQQRALNWTDNLGGGIWKIVVFAACIGGVSGGLVLAISRLF